jgi:hypothetical protein
MHFFLTILKKTRIHLEVFSSWELKTDHLRPKDRVFNDNYYTLVATQSYLFSVTRSLKHKFEVPEVLTVVKYLKGNSMR